MIYNYQEQKAEIFKTDKVRVLFEIMEFLNSNSFSYFGDITESLSYYGSNFIPVACVHFLEEVGFVSLRSYDKAWLTNHSPVNKSYTKDVYKQIAENIIKYN